MIYWLKTGDTGAVKVGYAADVVKRVKGLQCAALYPLVLLREASKHWHRLVAAAMACGIPGITFEALEATKPLASTMQAEPAVSPVPA